MLVGTPPHGGTLADRMRSEHGRRIALALPRGAVPDSFLPVWRRMVADRPDERLATMAETERLLRQAFEGTLPRPRQWSRRQLIAAASATALGGVGLAAWFESGPRPARVQQRPQLGPPPPSLVSPLAPREVEARQLAWADYLDLPLLWSSPGDAPLVLIPPGEFDMGVGDGQLPGAAAPAGDWRYRPPADEAAIHHPRHRVLISRPFYFGATEITNAQFRKFIESTAYVTQAEQTAGWGREDKGWVKRRGYCWDKLGQRTAHEDYPVMNVTWHDAIAYCEWLSRLGDRRTFRLPTEAEWEYLARAGSMAPYHFGEAAARLGDFAWYGENSDGLYRAVGLKRPNPLGVYDLYSNRQEWCLDYFAADYYRTSPRIDPLCQTDSALRVMRGGAHTDGARFCSAVTRWGQEADNPGAAGIRIVCEINAETTS
jgi:formylglycine-generating enzyme required for sulfatase activity